MSKASELWLRARLRPRDYDITEALDQLKLAPGELSEMVRDGMRLMLFGGGKDDISRPWESHRTEPRKG